MNFRDAQPLQVLSPNLNRRSIIKNDTRQLKAPTAKRRFRDKNYSSNIFPHILSMYKKAPTNSVDLYKFEKLAMCRYKILLELDSLAAVSAKHSEDWRRRLEERLATIKVEEVELGKWFTEDVKVEKLNSSEYQTNILYDQWSHFILKLAYSRNEELKNWFLQHETDLFQYRLDKQTTHKYDLSIDKFMELENVELRKTDESIKRNQYINAQILEDHKRSKYNDPNTQKPKVPQNPKNEYYECSWMDVLHLVKTRQVHIENGKAYVPKNLIKHILVERFREEMKMKLAQGRKHWASGGLQSEEKRLLPILNYFSKQNIQDYSSKNIDENTLTSKNIDDRAVTSYPLCMSNIHNHWRKTHHLKHFARLSYWRFLKSAGLSMEDCLKLFRDEGSKYPNGAKQFEKEFAYNIKHAYGKVGARAEYSGFSCAKILSEHVSQGDCHGCPYKNDSEEELVAKLKASGISEVEQLKEVLKLKSSGHFQLACAKQFQHGFGWFTDIILKKDIVDIEDIASGLVNPNQYFDKSVGLLQGKLGVSKSVKSENNNNNKQLIKTDVKWITNEMKSEKIKQENLQAEANFIADDDFEVEGELEEEKEKEEEIGKVGDKKEVEKEPEKSKNDEDSDEEMVMASESEDEMQV